MSKVVFITGGSSGIGKSIGTFLSEKGYVVYGTSRNPETVKEKPCFPLIAMDVLDDATISNAVSEVIKKENKIDILINNAGVGITGPIEETPDAEIHRAFAINYYGPIKVLKAVLPYMRNQKSGFIINITSIGGYMGLPYRGIYSATKAALGVTIESLRMETKVFGIKMTTVAPGDFATNIAAGRYHAPVITGSPYEKQYSDTLKIMNEHVDTGSDPLEMAKAIYKIINTKKPKVHYRVGAFMQKISIALKRILPDTWYEKLLLKHYKL